MSDRYDAGLPDRVDRERRLDRLDIQSDPVAALRRCRRAADGLVSAACCPTWSRIIPAGSPETAARLHGLAERMQALSAELDAELERLYDDHADLITGGIA